MKMDRIHELLEQLEEAVREEFPDATKASINVYTDGYRDLHIERWRVDNDLPVEAWKRIELMEQHKINGEWSKDRSAEQNAYYKERKVLLEEGEENERMAV